MGLVFTGGGTTLFEGSHAYSTWRLINFFMFLLESVDCLYHHCFIFCVAVFFDYIANLLRKGGQYIKDTTVGQLSYN